MSFTPPASGSSVGTGPDGPWSLLLSMESQLVSLYVEHDELQRSLGLSDAQDVIGLVEQLRTEHAAGQAASETLRARVAELENTVAPTAEVAALRKKVAESEGLRRRIEESTVQVAAATAREVVALERLADEQRRSDEAEFAEAETRRQHGALAEELVGTRRELEAQQSKHDNLASAYRVLEAAHDAARRDLERTTATLAGTSSELDGTRRELQHREAELASVRSNLDGVRAELEGAHAAFDHVRSERDGIRNQLTEVAGELERVLATNPLSLFAPALQMDEPTEPVAGLVGRLNELLQSVDFEPVPLDGVGPDIAEPVRRLEKRITSVVHLVDSVSGLLKERA